ncbi:SH3 domain-containing protein [Govanella unica]|uniref:SH3 domain-containing protein n=1 Tax=Govanella unica TaxID=2975056 RepID=A0A9X3Z7Y8_9PROT|nr:SH3 domain-containing protein [Govania unica]MDA5194626.1 SH3 domain-containing protein [Govania unica]
MIQRLTGSKISPRIVLCALVVSAVLAACLATAAETDSSGDTAAEDTRVGNSGLPVPRMVSLGAQEINMRSGPGTRYPIKWVYTRKSLPVQVEAEFDIWRKIRDRDGESGWVHGSMLSGRRTVEIRGHDGSAITVLRDKASDQSNAVLRAESGVIAELIECADDWCRLRIDGKKGWAPRQSLWGLMPGDGKKS